MSDAVHVGPVSDLRSLVNADHPQLGEVFDQSFTADTFLLLLIVLNYYYYNTRANCISETAMLSL